MTLTFSIVALVTVSTEDVDFLAKGAGSGASPRDIHGRHLHPGVLTDIIAFRRAQQLHMLRLYTATSVNELLIHVA